jgi:hypothetical protein
MAAARRRAALAAATRLRRRRRTVHALRRPQNRRAPLRARAPAVLVQAAPASARRHLRGACAPWCRGGDSERTPARRCDPTPRSAASSLPLYSSPIASSRRCKASALAAATARDAADVPATAPAPTARCRLGGIDLERCAAVAAPAATDAAFTTTASALAAPGRGMRDGRTPAAAPAPGCCCCCCCCARAADCGSGCWTSAPCGRSCDM